MLGKDTDIMGIAGAGWVQDTIYNIITSINTSSDNYTRQVQLPFDFIMTY